MLQTQWIDNGGHAYLKVSIEDCARINMDTSKVSGYSGLDATHFYLEEDCDASIFANAAKQAGEQWTNENVTYNEHYRCPKNYNPAKARMMCAEFIARAKQIALFILFAFLMCAGASAQTTKSVQCTAIAKSTDKQCTRMTTNSDSLCWQHTKTTATTSAASAQGATKSAAIQCTGRTKAGQQCKNKTTQGSKCHLHRG